MPGGGILCNDRDAEAARSIQWARKGLTSIALGNPLWDDDTRCATDASGAFRQFSKNEMQQVRGAMSEDAQKDLRAVHFQFGFLAKDRWESEAANRDAYWKIQKTTMPDRPTKNMQLTQFKFSCLAQDPIASGSKQDHRGFTKSEVDDAKVVMADSVKKDLRAVHIFAPTDKIDWQSESRSMAKKVKEAKAPERHGSKELAALRASNIYLGEDRLDYTSGTREAMREFSKKEVSSVKSAMSKAVQDDLRAVHFWLGTDKTVLDRHIRDRPTTGSRLRPQSAPLGRTRPQSAPHCTR